jgi:hypothetical protein
MPGGRSVPNGDIDQFYSITSSAIIGRCAMPFTSLKADPPSAPANAYRFRRAGPETIAAPCKLLIEASSGRIALSRYAHDVQHPVPRLRSASRGCFRSVNSG